MATTGKGIIKRKKCVKPTAYPCKGACISRKKNCPNPLVNQAATAVQWMTDQQTRLEIANKKRAKAGLSEARLDAVGYIVADKPVKGKAIAEPKARDSKTVLAEMEANAKESDRLHEELQQIRQKQEKEESKWVAMGKAPSVATGKNRKATQKEFKATGRSEVPEYKPAYSRAEINKQKNLADSLLDEYRKKQTEWFESKQKDGSLREEYDNLSRREMLAGITQKGDQSSKPKPNAGEQLKYNELTKLRHNALLQMTKSRSPKAAKEKYEKIQAELAEFEKQFPGIKHTITQTDREKAQWAKTESDGLKALADYQKQGDRGSIPNEVDKLQAFPESKKAIKELIGKNISTSVFDSIIEHDAGNYEGGGGQFVVTLSTSNLTKANLDKLAIALSPNKTKTMPPLIKSDGDVVTITYRNADHQYSGAMDEMNGIADRLKTMGIGVSGLSDKKSDRQPAKPVEDKWLSYTQTAKKELPQGIKGKIDRSPATVYGDYAIATDPNGGWRVNHGAFQVATGLRNKEDAQALVHSMIKTFKGKTFDQIAQDSDLPSGKVYRDWTDTTDKLTKAIQDRDIDRLNAIAKSYTPPSKPKTETTEQSDRGSTSTTKAITDAKKAVKEAEKSVNEAKTSAIRRKVNPDIDQAVARAEGKLYDAQEKLTQLSGGKDGDRVPSKSLTKNQVTPISKNDLEDIKKGDTLYFKKGTSYFPGEVDFVNTNFGDVTLKVVSSSGGVTMKTISSRKGEIFAPKTQPKPEATSEGDRGSVTKEQNPIIDKMNDILSEYGWNIKDGKLFNSKGTDVHQIEIKGGRIKLLNDKGELRGSLYSPDGIGQYIEKTFYAAKKAPDTKPDLAGQGDLFNPPKPKDTPLSVKSEPMSPRDRAIAAQIKKEQQKGFDYVPANPFPKKSQEYRRTKEELQPEIDKLKSRIDEAKAQGKTEKQIKKITDDVNKKVKSLIDENAKRPTREAIAKEINEKIQKFEAENPKGGAMQGPSKESNASYTSGGGYTPTAKAYIAESILKQVPLLANPPEIDGVKLNPMATIILGQYPMTSRGGIRKPTGQEKKGWEQLAKLKLATEDNGYYRLTEKGRDKSADIFREHPDLFDPEEKNATPINIRIPGATTLEFPRFDAAAYFIGKTGVDISDLQKEADRLKTLSFSERRGITRLETIKLMALARRINYYHKAA